MKKVRITESQLRGMVRNMLMEQSPMATGIAAPGFVQPQGAAPSSLTTSASKQSTTLQSQKNKQQQTTLSNVDNIVKLSGQFLNLMNGVNKNTLGPEKMTKQTLISNFTKLLTDLGYK
jgi:hypothetical protein